MIVLSVKYINYWLIVSGLSFRFIKMPVFFSSAGFQKNIRDEKPMTIKYRELLCEEAFVLGQVVGGGGFGVDLELITAMHSFTSAHIHFII